MKKMTIEKDLLDPIKRILHKKKAIIKFVFPFEEYFDIYYEDTLTSLVDEKEIRDEIRDEINQ